MPLHRYSRTPLAPGAEEPSLLRAPRSLPSDSSAPLCLSVRFTQLQFCQTFHLKGSFAFKSA